MKKFDRDKKPNGFFAIKDELCRRTKQPLGQFTFWMYMLIAVVILGGAGIWYEIVMLINEEGRDINSLKMAFLTFSPAVIGTSTLIMIFEAQRSRELMAFGLICLVIMFVSFILLVSIRYFDGWWGLWPSAVLAIVSIWVWWVANGDNAGLHDKIDPIDSVGGEIDQTPKGTTEGWDI